MANLTDSHTTAARRLLARACANAEPEDWASVSGRVYEGLFRQLAPVLGGAGVRALLARCLKLNKAKFPALADVRLPAESPDQEVQSAQSIARALGTLDRESGLEAATDLFATFFALLMTFIGERLTRQIVQQAFAEDDGTASTETG